MISPAKACSLAPYEPHVEGVDQGASYVFAGRLADVGEGLQYRCVDGVMHWWRGHAAGCSAGSLPRQFGLHRLLSAAVNCSATLFASVFAPLWSDASEAQPQQCHQRGAREPLNPSDFPFLVPRVNVALARK